MQPQKEKLMFKKCIVIGIIAAIVIIVIIIIIGL